VVASRHYIKRLPVFGFEGVNGQELSPKKRLTRYTGRRIFDLPVIILVMLKRECLGGSLL
jgi:hypothetical protein